MPSIPGSIVQSGVRNYMSMTTNQGFGTGEIVELLPVIVTALSLMQTLYRVRKLDICTLVGRMEEGVVIRATMIGRLCACLGE